MMNRDKPFYLVSVLKDSKVQYFCGGSEYHDNWKKALKYNKKPTLTKEDRDSGHAVILVDITYTFTYLGLKKDTWDGV